MNSGTILFIVWLTKVAAMPPALPVVSFSQPTVSAAPAQPLPRPGIVHRPGA